MSLALCISSYLPTKGSDIRKARLQVGFKPEVDLEDGLARFLGWADENYSGEA